MFVSIFVGAFAGAVVGFGYETLGLDLGWFHPVRPDQLVVPLDTHVARIGGNLGLTRRRTADWTMAAQITDGLRALDPADPVRYDFAISRLGILDKCPRRVDAAQDRAAS